MDPSAVARLRSALADRYTLERELGRGGMATVWLARDLKHDRLVALKVLRPELAQALGPERFLREIAVTAGLDHPHILPLLDSGEAAGFLYYTMPHVEGESLRDRLNREKQLPIDDALAITREVADALGYAHSRGVVHRDIKPENILLAGDHERQVDAIGSYLRVVYFCAYYVDCGPPLGSECFIPACDPHSGDSEFTITDLRYDAASTHWVAQQVFLSAHCPFSAANWDCRWYPRAAFAWVGGQRYGAPVVWVSEGKHANYPNASACEEGGAYNSDSCEFNDSSRRIPIVYTQQNVGSRTERLQDCMPPFWGSPLTDPSTQECMWRTHGVQRFNGWQSAVYGASPQRYGDILLNYAGF